MLKLLWRYLTVAQTHEIHLELQFQSVQLQTCTPASFEGSTSHIRPQPRELLEHSVKAVAASYCMFLNLLFEWLLVAGWLINFFITWTWRAVFVLLFLSLFLSLFFLGLVVSVFGGGAADARVAAAVRPLAAGVVEVAASGVLLSSVWDRGNTQQLHFSRDSHEIVLCFWSRWKAVGFLWRITELSVHFRQHETRSFAWTAV